MTDDIDLGAGLTCFIISPIGNRLEPVGSAGRSRYEESIVMWEEVFEPASAQFGMAAVRSDRIAESGDINDQIFTYLRDADVVIADLSHANPNVMYELGLRHSVEGKITLQIGEYGLLPFDVNTIRTTQFNRTRAGLIGARNELTEALRVALAVGGTPSRATAILGGAARAAMDLQNDVARSVAPEDDADAPAEPGIVEVLAEGELALIHISEVLENSSTLMSDIGDLSASFAARVAESDGKGKGFAGRLLLTRELAAVMDGPAGEFELSSNAFLNDITTLDTMVQYMLNRYEEGLEEVDDDARTFFTGLLGLVESANGAAIGVTGFRDGARGMSKMSSALAPVSKILVRASGRFLEGIGIMGAWGPSAHKLIEAAA